MGSTKQVHGRALRATAGAALIAVVLATGCGASSTDSPGETAKAMFAAMLAGNGTRACGLMSDASVRAIETDGRTCVGLVAKLPDTIDVPSSGSGGSGGGSSKGLPALIAGMGGASGTKGIRFRVTSEEVHGDRATVVLVESSEGTESGDIPMVREDGKWKVDLIHMGSGGSSSSAADDCKSLGRTIETANEAFNVVNGRYARDQHELVTSQMLARDHPEFTVHGRTVEATPGGRCS